MLPETLLFAPPATLVVALLAAVFGLLVGSFLNVVIHRMPIMIQRETDNCVDAELERPLRHTDHYSLAVPRSACPHCGHQITAMENIPVLSYLALRGKCRSCKAPISARYPAIETLSAVLSGYMIWHFGSGVEGLAALFFTYCLLAMTFIDFDTQYLPDDLTLPLMWVGLLLNLNGTFVPLREAVIGAAVGYLALWSVNALYKLVRKQDGMGYGDFKLLAALGAWMGWTMLPTIILLSSVVGSVVGISLILLRKHGRDIPIPFGPYLAGAGMLALLFGTPIARYTLTLLGQ